MKLLFVEYEVLFLQACVKLLHCIINVLFFLRSCADKVPACEQKNYHPRLVHPVDQSWKLFWTILDSWKTLDNSVQIDLLVQGCSRNNVLNVYYCFSLRH